MTELEKILSETVTKLLDEIESAKHDAKMADGYKNTWQQIAEEKGVLISTVQSVLSKSGYRIDMLSNTISSIIEWYDSASIERDKLADKYYLLRAYMRCIIGKEHNEKFKKMLNSVSGMKELRKLRNKSGD